MVITLQENEPVELKAFIKTLIALCENQHTAEIKMDVDVSHPDCKIITISGFEE